MTENALINPDGKSVRPRPKRADVEAAVRLLIEWTGDNPDREGLIDAPARVIEGFAKRLQIQETLTSQIADTIQNVLQPRGGAVVNEAVHMCITTRGVRKPGVSMVTRRLLGAFQTDKDLRRDFLSSLPKASETIGS